MLLPRLLRALFGVLFPGYSFAALVANRATRLAGRLAGASAFAASGNFLFGGFCNSLNHSKISLNIRLYGYYKIYKPKNQVFLRFFYVYGYYARNYSRGAPEDYFQRKCPIDGERPAYNAEKHVG